MRKEPPALKTGAPFYHARLLAFRSPWKGLWPRVIEAGFKNMKREDALAIADYLKSIPPIKNKIK